jgi:HSP20 family protein
MMSLGHPGDIHTRLFTHFFSEPCFSGNRLAHPEQGKLPLDVSEDDKNVIVRASVPGFARDDIEVQVHNGILTIKATHNDDSEERGERYFRRERTVSSMSRRVALPSTVEDNKTQAELKDGVLTLHIPKSEQAQPRKVQIK